MDNRDGGPAHPCNPDRYGDPNEGMTLRDYLAAQALAGMLGGPTVGAIHLVSESRGITAAAAVATASYEYADAMLEARKR